LFVTKHKTNKEVFYVVVHISHRVCVCNEKNCSVFSKEIEETSQHDCGEQ
jgi:hypothetical protein